MGALLTRRKALIALMLVSLLPATVSARSFWRWWRRPPTDPVTNTAFASVEVGRAALRLIGTEGRRVTSYDVVQLEGEPVEATVEESVLTVGAITLVSVPDEEDPEAEPVTVTVTLEDATLRPNIFNSSFRTKGTMVIGEGEAVDVYAGGYVVKRDGVYILRLSVRGYTVDIGDGTRDYTLLGAYLSGEGEPIVDEEEVVE
jgi:hypothetical protein